MARLPFFITMAKARCGDWKSPVAVGRYHSLRTRKLPPRIQVHAELDGMAMAFSDAEALQTGLQFHPESVLTLRGGAIPRNVIEDHCLRPAIRDESGLPSDGRMVGN